MKKSEIVFLLVALLLVTFLHSRYIRETYYDHDVAGYVYNTLDVLQGRGWYASTWHSKPPGINLIFLLTFSILGQSFKSIYIAALIANAFSVFFIYLLGRHILNTEAKFYFLLPLFYGLFCISEGVQGHSANTETFLATFEIAGMLFLGLAYKKKRNVFWFVSGLLLGMGFMIKQVGMITFIAGLVFIYLIKIIDKESIKFFIKKLFIFILAFIIPLCLFAIYFLSVGVFEKFLKYTFIYNIQYLKDMPLIREKALLHSLRIVWNTLGLEISIFSLFLLPAIFYTFFKSSAIRFLVLIWFWVYVLVSINFANFPHYFISGIAPFVCLGVIGLSDIYQKVRHRRILIILIFILLIIPYIHTLTFVLRQDKPVASAYRAEERFLTAQYIKAHTAPEDKIFVWDDNDACAIYFWSGRANITKFRYKYFFLPEELVWPWYRAVVRDYKLNQRDLLLRLRQELPVYIVVFEDWKERLESEKEAFFDFFNILEKDYFLEEKIEGCLIYRRIYK